MEYKIESSLSDFQAWEGGLDTLNVLKEKGDCEAVEEFIIECADLNEGLTEGQINDILWFERDRIAQHLGYDDWDTYEYGEKFEDINGVEINIGDTVYWHDEAGEEEDGTMIEFVVTDEDGEGNFDLSLDDDDLSERWACHDEIEVIKTM